MFKGGIMKVGEGNSPKPITASTPENDLKSSAIQFKKSFEEYQKVPDSKKHAMDRMQREIGLMDASSVAATKKEVRVQEQKVSFDFQIFQKNPSKENAAILEHDLNTLRESLER